MIYKFDTIKNQWILFAIMVGITFFVILSIILSYIESFINILPDFLIRSFIPQIIFGTILFIVFTRFKRTLFWNQLDISIDNMKRTISINNSKFDIDKLEYYKFRKGSVVTTGEGRDVVILKFKNKKKFMIMPCRTSEEIHQYDSFITHFKEFVKQTNCIKEKKISKTTRIVLLAVNLALIILITVIWQMKGFHFAIKVLPSVLVFFSVTSIYIFKK